MNRVRMLAVLLLAAAGAIASGREPDAGPSPCWRERLHFRADRSEVRAVAFSPDGVTLAIGGMEGTVKLWDVQTGRKSAELRDDRQDVSIRALAFSPDGKTLAVAVHRTPADIIVLWDVPTKRPRHILKKEGIVASLAFSPGGQTLATGPLLKLWDVATGRQTRTLQRNSRIGTFHQLCFSPDGKLLAAGFGNEYPVTNRPNGTIQVWDVATAEERLTLEDRAGIDALAFSSDGKLLASAGRHGDAVTLWEVATGKRQALLQLPDRPAIQCFAVAFAPDGKTLATGCRNRLGNAPADELVGVVLWEVNTRQPRALLKGDGDIVRSLTFSPDGKTLAAGRGTGMVTVWQIAPPRPAK